MFRRRTTVTFTFVVTVPVVVNINIPGSGTVSPNLNGTSQAIGKALSMSAKAAKGYAFVSWDGATNTSSSKISFVMASNLVFNANFKDITRPVNVILTPTKGQVFSNSVATGRAMDNVGVASVWYQLNSGAWTQANSAMARIGRRRMCRAQLIAGANTISAYALDAAGNASLTNTIAFSYVVRPTADWAPDSLIGLLAAVAPDSGAQEAVGFDQTTFSQTSSSNDGNPDDYGAGTYTYSKTDTNLAQLSLAFSAPPGSSNNIGPITLVFTNHYAGYFTNDRRRHRRHKPARVSHNYSGVHRGQNNLGSERRQRQDDQDQTVHGHDLHEDAGEQLQQRLEFRHVHLHALQSAVWGISTPRLRARRMPGRRLTCN